MRRTEPFNRHGASTVERLVACRRGRDHVSLANEDRNGDGRPDRSQREPSAEQDVAPKRDEGDGDAGRSSVLERAFQVLEQVAGGARPLNLTEVSRATNLPLPTTYRLATALVKLGALEKDAGRYTLGPVWLQWSEAAGQEHTCTSS
ncbi:helix-turn-helix domain-containing protein [Saccharothrix xinjiangensis]|uniref:Helix-turn-helix domain-containing protein n=1 Tax=Saccharothrix xinjiangensis TaxID=204798 RepID=A0ABV9YDN2_9PSEU